MAAPISPNTQASLCFVPSSTTDNGDTILYCSDGSIITEYAKIKNDFLTERERFMSALKESDKKRFSLEHGFDLSSFTKETVEAWLSFKNDPSTLEKFSNTDPLWALYKFSIFVNDSELNKAIARLFETILPFERITELFAELQINPDDFVFQMALKKVKDNLKLFIHSDDFSRLRPEQKNELLKGIKLCSLGFLNAEQVISFVKQHGTGLKYLDLSGIKLQVAGIVEIISYLQNLTSLDLCGNDIGKEGAAALANSPYLQNFTSLGLRYNLIGKEGAVALANSPHLRHLTNLDLSHNLPYNKRIGDEEVAVLRERFPRVKV